MKVKVPYIIHLQTGNAEIFNDEKSCKERVEFLRELEGVQLNYYINSSEGHEYFQHAHDFYAKIKSLSRNGKRFVPLVKPTANEPFISLNLYRHLQREIGSV